MNLLPIIYSSLLIFGGVVLFILILSYISYKVKNSLVQQEIVITSEEMRHSQERNNRPPVHRRESSERLIRDLEKKRIRRNSKINYEQRNEHELKYVSERIKKLKSDVGKLNENRNDALSRNRSSGRRYNTRYQVLQVKNNYGGNFRPSFDIAGSQARFSGSALMNYYDDRI